MIAKYFATSLAIENVVSEPRVISICLPISTISISLVGFESRSTMLPASFAACVPVFIATATSACASAGASLVASPVVAGHHHGLDAHLAQFGKALLDAALHDVLQLDHAEHARAMLALFGDHE